MGCKNESLVWLVATLPLWLCLNCISVVGLENDNLPIQEWYKRYASYPKYCSTPEEMSTRSIPPLSSPDVNSKLLHVTAVIRHGGRTPYRVIECWDGFWTNPDTGIWDCDLKTLMSPPAPPQIEQDEGGSKFIDPELAGAGNMFLFEKVYDALDDGLSNEMNGTCQKGQLLLRGYAQEFTNGQLLQSTYFNSSDPRLRLWNDTDSIADKENIYQPPHFYYRADDDQRTLMSGQVLIRSLFHKLLPPDHDPTIVLHTADRDLDRLDANHKACPRLKDLELKAYESQEYKDYLNSEETKLLTKMMKQEMGRDFQDDAVDCLMTTMCTDRPLPTILNDFTPSNDSTQKSDDYLNYADTTYGSNRFQRLAKMVCTFMQKTLTTVVNFHTFASKAILFFFSIFNSFSFGQAAHPFLFPMYYNNGEHSKLAMGPLWDGIMKHISPLLSKNNPDLVPKMALISGHDSTIMPLLATLGLWNGVDWTPYASMFLIEVHETDQFASQRAFRIIYNGEVITPKMNGCASELCDLTVLTEAVKDFATSTPDCTSRIDVDDERNESNREKSKDIFLTILWTVGVAILSCIAGSLGTFFYVSRRLPYCNTKRAMYKETPDIKTDDDDEEENVSCWNKKHVGPIHQAVEVTTVPVSKII